MNNLALKSLLYILVSYIIISTTIFFYNNLFTIDHYFLTLRYTYHELMGLVLFLSQFIYITNGSNKSNRAVVIHSLICTTIFVLFDYLFLDYDNVSLTQERVSNIYINRDYLQFSKINFPGISYLKKIFSSIHHWDITEFLAISSFSLFMFNISIQVCLDRLYRLNTIIKVLAILCVFLFNLYIWNYTLNLYLLIFSFILLITVRNKN